jgi:hypothetical protein
MDIVLSTCALTALLAEEEYSCTTQNITIS